MRVTQDKAGRLSSHRDTARKQPHEELEGPGWDNGSPRLAPVGAGVVAALTEITTGGSLLWRSQRGPGRCQMGSELPSPSCSHLA